MATVMELHGRTARPSDVATHSSLSLMSANEVRVFARR